jgi:hypothetical protein
LNDPALLDPYLSALKVPEHIVPISPAGQLEFMPAGPFELEETGYARLLNSLDLATLYDQGFARAVAKVFREWLRTREYDYVLIDSRTGLNLVAELCVGDLADAVVMLTGLNEQNLAGTAYFARQLAMDSLPEDMREVVFSPVPQGERELRDKRKIRAKELLGDLIRKEPIELPYDPRLPLLDEAMIDYDPEAPIASRYIELTSRVARFASDDEDHLTNLFPNEGARSTESRRTGLEVLRRLAPQNKSLAIRLIWGLESSLEEIQHIEPEWSEGIQDLLDDLSPSDHIGLYNWGSTLGYLARLGQGEEAEALLLDACRKYEAAIAVKADKQEAHENWSTALIHLSYIAEQSESLRLLSEALDKATRADTIVPGSGAYNAACACALLDRPDDARAWLQRSRDADVLPDLEHLESDTDLDKLSDLDWFQDLLNDLRSE